MTTIETEAVSAPESPSQPPSGPDTAPPAPRAVTVDADAPYGRTADGRPKAKPGRKAKAPGGSPTPPRRRSSAPRTGPSARKSAPPKPSYSEGLQHYLRAGIGAMVTFGRRSVPMQANAMTLARYGPDVCDALGDIAEQDPRWAGAFDRVMGAGPYAELAEKLSPLVLQLLVNNRVVPLEVGRHMGAEDPEMLAAMLRASAAERAAQGVS